MTTTFVSPTEIKTPIKVLDRRIKRGFLWDSFYVTFRLLDPSLTIQGCNVFEFEVSRQNYYDMEPSTEGTIKLYKHKNNRWYSRPEA